MNYPFREAIIAYMKGEAATTFRDRIMGILENYPKCTVDVLMNFVSTHDIERAINRFGGQPCDDKSKDWMASNELSPEEYERGKTLLKGAMVLQFFLPVYPASTTATKPACRAGRIRSTAAAIRGDRRTPSLSTTPASWQRSGGNTLHLQRVLWNFWCWRTMLWDLPAIFRKMAPVL